MEKLFFLQNLDGKGYVPCDAGTFEEATRAHVNLFGCAYVLHEGESVNLLNPGFITIVTP